MEPVPKYKIIGFIDTLNTRRMLESACPQGQWLAKPSGHEPTLHDSEIVLVLHVSQKTDDGFSLSPYSIFELCIDALAEDKWIDRRVEDHFNWIKYHQSQLKALVLTSGADVLEEKVAAANGKLRELGITVLGSRSKELALQLRLCAKEVETGEFLSCLTGNSKIETALRVLSALLPFGLDSDRIDFSAHCSLMLAASESMHIRLSRLERFIILLLKSYWNGDPSDASQIEADQRSIAIVNNLLVESGKNLEIVELWKREGAAVPSSLIDAVKIIAESANSEQWNARLTVLRESLIPNQG